MTEYQSVEMRDWYQTKSRPAGYEEDDNWMYQIPVLDYDWYQVLGHKLKTPDGGRDVIDAKPFDTKRVQLSREYSTVDEIDARGTIDATELEHELRSMSRVDLEEKFGISIHKIKDIIRRADIHKNGNIEYKAFLETVKRYRLSSEQESTLKGFVRAFAYAEEFTCMPPTFFMIFITILETACFTYHAVHLPRAHNQEITWEGPVPYCSVFIYNPHRRWEAWRFFTYMFVHIGIGHFVFNMFMQIIVGVFLEMEQEGWLGSLRVAVVYLAGVLAGSLGTSLSDPYTYIAGASGGVYALIAAHLATLALNWQEDSAVRIQKVIHKPLTRIVRLVFISLLTLHDVAFAIYVRLFTDGGNRTGFIGHFCGALAGLLVGIFILDNRRVRTWETWIQWIAISIFTLMLIFAVVWNIFANEWMQGFFPPPDYRLYDDESGNCKHYEYI